MEKYKNFINNRWIDSESKETIKVDDPATGKVIGEISCAKKTEVDLAINAARKSYNSRILFDMPLLARAKLMRKRRLTGKAYGLVRIDVVKCRSQ